MGASVIALTLTITAILYREIGRRVAKGDRAVDKSRKVVRPTRNCSAGTCELLKTSAALTAERGRLQRLNRELAQGEGAGGTGQSGKNVASS